MTVGVGRGSAREILVVLALAVTGLLLAVLAAFTPWYGVAAGSPEVEVVEMHSPPWAITDGGELAAVGEG
ncbi:hypothetical protein I0C86_30795 [Plantactinospora sp. S1510]|uniref:ABC transporter permease n=1 Tax=Plantactinospora alkalitolerans TaxID=2789879 RepID=A0ABS0H4Q3_9ACTN|nr:hypothetical protein [Plantactinospora alkalitolerans]MBF9133319.1 hypothetical protein [Plantactinospora alkalitolerans]